MKPEQLLAEIEDLLRTMPNMLEVAARLGDDDTVERWTGRFSAVMNRWSPGHLVAIHQAAGAFYGATRLLGPIYAKRLLYEARTDLQLQLGWTGTVVPQGGVFEYFDELRKLIEMAQSEVFFIDPYLDADFVARYLPQVGKSATIRLLSSTKKLASLKPAVEMFAMEFGARVSLRSADEIHDRYIIIDGQACYQSGASFKDGAKNAPVGITQITDAFTAVRATYEGIWQTATVVI
jgi:hypothetical protein